VRTKRRNNMTNSKVLSLAIGSTLILVPASAFAMHIAEGILPFGWALLWGCVAAPFLAWGLRELRVRSASEPLYKQMVALVGAAVFVISCLPIPVPIAGSTAHPCGTGLAAILIGPAITVVVASVALVLQALFLAHGGLTSLGANIVSMGVVGAYVGYLAFRLARYAGVPWWGAAFLAGLLSDWATYAITALELAAALHGARSTSTVFLGVIAAFVPTQIPLGLVEGVISAGAYRMVRTRRPELLRLLLGRKPL
jgi:cobalt/nickel transport system permease protein